MIEILHPLVCSYGWAFSVILMGAAVALQQPIALALDNSRH